LITDIFTNNTKFINKIPKEFIIRNIYTEKKTLRLDTGRKILVLNKKNINKIKKDNNNLGLIFNFGLIIPEKIIKSYKLGIINIHKGDLPKYRGRNPLVWAFLNNEKKIGVTSHLIDIKIDRGYLLKKIFIKRNYNDDIETIDRKIIQNIPKLILQSKINLLKKNYKIIKKGKYWPSIKKKFKILNSKAHDYIYLMNLIKSQKIYGGVEINKKIIVDSFFYKKRKKLNKKLFVILCKGEKKLLVLKK
tara:strand:+ start:581 stop:1321 length:741 start_codon:yes stop_codon:yes gene_type:complete